MRLVRFDEAGTTRPGALIDDDAVVVDLQAAAASYLHRQGDPRADEEARLRLPANTAELLVGGHRSITLACAAIEHALAHHNDSEQRLTIPRGQIRLAMPTAAADRVRRRGPDAR